MHDFKKLLFPCSVDTQQGVFRKYVLFHTNEELRKTIYFLLHVENTGEGGMEVEGRTMLRPKNAAEHILLR